MHQGASHGQCVYPSNIRLDRTCVTIAANSLSNKKNVLSYKKTHTTLYLGSQELSINYVVLIKVALWIIVVTLIEIGLNTQLNIAMSIHICTNILIILIMSI